jgi:hypothetical protein
MKTEDIKKMAQAWQQVQEASKKNEELVGKQHKLDHNKNGKIDAADFKGLRNKSKKNAETETVTSEETVNEISKKTLGSYVKKASYDAASNAAKFGANEPDKKGGSAFVKAHNRLRGITKATDRLTKEEVELDEEVFAMDIDYNQEKRLAAAAKAAGIAIKFVQAGGATEMQLRGDKDKITKFLKARRVPASEISRGWFNEEVELDEVTDQERLSARKIQRDAQTARHGIARKPGESMVAYLNRAKKHKEKMQKEETNWPVYERIKENRAAHYKGATKPETMDDKLKGKGAKDMANQPVNTSDIPATHPTDIQKAAAVKKAPARTGDQTKGDTKIINPVKDTTK